MVYNLFFSSYLVFVVVSAVIGGVVLVRVCFRVVLIWVVRFVLFVICIRMVIILVFEEGEEDRVIGFL